MARKSKEEAKRYEWVRLRNAVSIPEDCGLQPGNELKISVLIMQLNQIYGQSRVHLTKNENSYHIIYSYLSPSMPQVEASERDTTPIESAWIEKLVENTFNNPDEAVWQSIPGGDLMYVKIQFANTQEFKQDMDVPLQKFYDLFSELKRFTEYGSRIVSEKNEQKANTETTVEPEESEPNTSTEIKTEEPEESEPNTSTEIKTEATEENTNRNDKDSSDIGRQDKGLSLVTIIAILAFPIIGLLLSLINVIRKKKRSAKSAAIAMIAGLAIQSLFFFGYVWWIAR